MTTTTTITATDIDKINSTYLTPDQIATNSAARGEARKVGDSDFAANKDMFLQLLVAQLKNQDPSSPMDQKDMMAQMAQFTQVEQSANMVKAVQTLSFNATVSQSISMIGHSVDYAATAPDGTDTSITSKVTSISTIGNAVKLTLENGVSITPTDVIRVA